MCSRRLLRSNASYREKETLLPLYHAGTTHAAKSQLSLLHTLLYTNLLLLQGFDHLCAEVVNRLHLRRAKRHPTGLLASSHRSVHLHDVAMHRYLISICLGKTLLRSGADVSIHFHEATTQQPGKPIMRPTSFELTSCHFGHELSAKEFKHRRNVEPMLVSSGRESWVRLRQILASSTCPQLDFVLK